VLLVELLAAPIGHASADGRLALRAAELHVPVPLAGVLVGDELHQLGAAVAADVQADVVREGLAVGLRSGGGIGHGYLIGRGLRVLDPGG
jgi:hypothetical protein